VDVKAALGILVSIWVALFAARQFLRRGPRARLTLNDWEPRGWLGLVSILCLGLIYGGGWVLFGRHQTFRVGGALALVGGLALLAVIIQYLRRPVLPSPSPEGVNASPADAVLPPFPRSAWGYTRAEVDAFFSDIWAKPRQQIEAVSFSVRFRGYCRQEVDRALDGWSVRQSVDQAAADVQGNARRA
jgi:DivIVA domain-containing protein